MYQVVEFNDSGVGVIRRDWWTPQKKRSLWPPFKASLKINKCLLKQILPDDNWTVHPVRRVLYETDDLDKANIKCKKAETESELASSEEAEPVKRRKKRNQVFLSTDSTESDEDNRSGDCDRKCKGPPYRCIESTCFCSLGYVPNPTQSRCLKCPGYGESCFGVCCNHNGNATLSCWKGICQPCYDNHNRWICRDSMDHILIVSSTQIAMATALVLGIIATFVLLHKLCAVTAVRPLGNVNGSPSQSRLSIGSLQVYIDERLRDAPPRYTRAPPLGSIAVVPTPIYINAGFVHDSSIPPPPYTIGKDEENQNPVPTVHI